MARGKQVDRELVELILQMKERNQKLTTEQIGAVTNCDATTAGRIIKCGTWEKYQEFKKEKAEKGRKREQARKTEPQDAEEQVPGQITMQLDPEEEIVDQKPEMSDQVKLMRFQAAQVDKIIGQMMVNVDALLMKLDRLNDTMSMILRAVRKE